MAHPDVLEASVVGVPDERWGERPLATVVLRDGSTVATPEALRGVPRRTSSRTGSCPSAGRFIDEVPKTSVGKFDKKVLRKRYAEGDLEVVTVN